MYFGTCFQNPFQTLNINSNLLILLKLKTGFSQKSDIKRKVKMTPDLQNVTFEDADQPNPISDNSNILWNSPSLGINSRYSPP